MPMDVMAVWTDPSNGRTSTHLAWARRHADRVASRFFFRHSSDNHADVTAEAVVYLCEEAAAFAEPTNGEDRHDVFRRRTCKGILHTATHSALDLLNGGLFKPKHVRPGERSSIPSVGHTHLDPADKRSPFARPADGRNRAPRLPLDDMILAEEMRHLDLPFTTADIRSIADTVRLPPMPHATAAPTREQQAILHDYVDWAEFFFTHGMTIPEVCSALRLTKNQVPNIRRRLRERQRREPANAA